MYMRATDGRPYDGRGRDVIQGRSSSVADKDVADARSRGISSPKRPCLICTVLICGPLFDLTFFSEKYVYYIRRLYRIWG